MKKFYTVLFSFISIFAFGQLCNSYGEAQIDLNVNNINARLLNSGDLWWDGANAQYVTTGDGIDAVSGIFAGALWIGGMDPNQNVKLAGQTYRVGGQTDWYPGPLDEIGQSYENGCDNWDRFWVVNKTEVQDHKNDFNDGTIQNQIPNIYGWPGRNNPHFESIYGFPLPQDLSFAPFWDEDQNGAYDPDFGDYPLIKGDQSIWWVFNDYAGLHRVTQGPAIQMEVHGMAYAYSSTTNEDLNNTTFYDFKMINKATDFLQDAFIGLWVDFDLGCYTDDFVGYNEEYQMMYAYNEDAIDGSDDQGGCQGGINTYGSKIPMIGIKKLDGSFNPVSSFISTLGDSGNPATIDPQTDQEFYNLLNGKWRDGTPLSVGGNGYDPASTDITSFAFNGDPSLEDSWSMCNAGLPFGDYRSVMSSAMPTLNPGQSTTASYAIIVVEDVPHPCPSLDRLKDAADNICEVADITSTNQVGVFDMIISPNPATDRIEIKTESSISTIKLISMNGQLITKNENINGNRFDLDLTGVNTGMYLLNVTNDEGHSSVEKIVVNR